MIDDDAERRKRYAECRTDLLKRQLSNSENFDRSVLCLSSGLLAASIAFINHAPKVPALINEIERRDEFTTVKLAWASGLRLVVRAG